MARSRLAFYGKGITFHLMPLSLLTVFFVVVFAVFYVPPTSSLSFFGFYAGTVNTFGVHWEHEFVGVGMLVALALVAPLMGTNKAWFVSLALIGAFLVLSDITSIIAGNLFTNTIGVEASVMMGVIIGVLAGGIITGGGKTKGLWK